MKSFTDIEQSKKLAEILPIESADAWWAERYEGKVTNDWQYIVNEEPFYYISFIKPSETNYSQDIVKDIPCWSLAALLGVLPFHLIVDNQRYAFSMIKGLDKNGETYAIKYAVFNTTIHFHLTDFYSNPVDACYEMILKLHKQKLL